MDTVPSVIAKYEVSPRYDLGPVPSPGPPRPMTPPVHPIGVFHVFPPSWLSVASRLTVMFPGVDGPLRRMFVEATAGHAVATFLTSQIESVPHLGSSEASRFDWVPLTVSTASGEGCVAVSQYQRQRQGGPDPGSSAGLQSPGSRPPRLTHFACAETGAPYPTADGVSPRATARRKLRNESASRATATPSGTADARFEATRSAPPGKAGRTANRRPASS